MCAGSLFTVMRPSRINCSISKREPMPAWASTLCSLGVSAKGASTRLAVSCSGSASWASNCPLTTSKNRSDAVSVASTGDLAASGRSASSWPLAGVADRSSDNSAGGPRASGVAASATGSELVGAAGCGSFSCMVVSGSDMKRVSGRWHSGGGCRLVRSVAGRTTGHFRQLPLFRPGVGHQASNRIPHPGAVGAIVEQWQLID